MGNSDSTRTRKTKIFWQCLYTFQQMSIIASKKQLAEAVELYNNLKSELDDGNNVDGYSEEEWQKRLRSLGIEAVS